MRWDEGSRTITSPRTYLVEADSAGEGEACVWVCVWVGGRVHGQAFKNISDGSSIL